MYIKKIEESLARSLNNTNTSRAGKKGGAGIIKKIENWPERRGKSRGSIVKRKRKFQKADIINQL